MNEELNKLITEMRMKDSKLKEYIFIDRDINAIWSFNTQTELYDFLETAYFDSISLEDLVVYNNGKVIVLPKQKEEE